MPRFARRSYEWLREDGEVDFPRTLTYRLTLPKFDNSGNRIDPSLLEKYPLEMAQRFGGVSVIPDIAGCFVNAESGALECEENFRVEVTVVERSVPEGRENEGFVRDLAHQAGLDLGQESVYEVEERDILAAFVPGERRASLPPEKLSRDLFRRVLGR